MGSRTFITLICCLLVCILAFAVAAESLASKDRQPRHRIVPIDAPTAAEAVAHGIKLRGQARREAPPPPPLAGRIDADGRLRIAHQRPQSGSQSESPPSEQPARESPE